MMTAVRGEIVMEAGEVVVVAEVEASVDSPSKKGKVHIFGLGEPAAVEPMVDEKPDEPESWGGFPGFPLESIVIGILLVMAIWLMRLRR